MNILYCIIIMFLPYNCNKTNTVYIQPLGDIEANYIKEIKNALKSSYNYDCIVLKNVSHNKNLFGKTNNRYDASKILNYFACSNRTLVITNKDITHYKSATYPEWGIFGLGSYTNNTCVVSTYRLGAGDKLIKRLRNVSVHEIGHTLGIEHCTQNNNCVMQDAKGTYKTVDLESIYLCNNCSKLIK